MYFGLLLVGGTPFVLAQHAATTKGFVLKDEIEVKDDLDRDPFDEITDRTEPTDAERFDEFALAYCQFLIEHHKDSKQFVSNLAASDGDVFRISANGYFTLFDPDLLRILGVSKHDIKSENLAHEIVTTIQIRYAPSSEELIDFQAAFTSIPTIRQKLWTTASNLVRENSFVTIQNGYLAVVTRLPRAALDPLLVK